MNKRVKKYVSIALEYLTNCTPDYDHLKDELDELECKLTPKDWDHVNSILDVEVERLEKIAALPRTIH